MEYSIRPNESVTEAVVNATSSYEDVPARSLPPLFEAVNTDALNDAFRPTDEGAGERTGCTSFAYLDNLVTVESSGFVTVEPRSDEPFSVEVGLER